MSAVIARRGALRFGRGLLGAGMLLGTVPAAALLSGCSSAPTRYYQLSALPGTPRQAAGLRLQLRRVAIPGTLDRAAIVRSGDGARLVVAEDDVWGEPFGDLVTRVLAENLRLRLPGATVAADGGAVDLGSTLILEVELQHFEAQGVTVLLQGQAALRRRNDPASLAVQALRAEAPNPGSDVAALVSAMNTALAAAADSLAAMVAGRAAIG